MFFDKEKIGLSNIKECINTNFITNIIVPTASFLVLPLTFSEWKLFWTGEKYNSI